ncbi:MAG TPA: outer membrane beta-barrel protein [Candidatus Didemnitutus sp.]|nr:outer membrane beta-barrel protein [Candidatus Didemnitutus sp.]
MKSPLRLALPFAAIAPVAFAVYAPIPDQEQGKALSLRLGASVYHDSNIFGAATGEISSMVYSLSPEIVFNSSVSDQTFVSAGYIFEYQYMPDRPGDTTLINQNLSLRLAHQFSPVTKIDLRDEYVFAQNPQSLLNGVPLNSDQSYKSNEFDARFDSTIGPKTGYALKYRNLVYSYDDAGLSTELDRMEQVAGVEVNFALMPQTKIAFEYRYQDISYDKNGQFKNKHSNFLLGGADYSPSERLTMSGRVGVEDRVRESQPDDTAPYVELSSRYSYSEGSYFAAGYTYTFEESTDPVRYTDSKVNRFFVNMEHKLSALVVASGSLTYQPAQLQGRAPFSNIDETTTRLGLGLSWIPTKNWTVSATYDLDHVESDDPSRRQDRDRYGVSARLVF